MSSNSRITRSKGPSDGTSLPPYTRPMKDTSTRADNTESMPTPTQQQTACDQLNSTIGHSPFARPGSRASESTVPATPIVRPGSRAGLARLNVDFPRVAPQATRPLNCNSPISSISDTMFPVDINTSTSWDLIDPDCDVEVAGITKGQTQQQVDQTLNTNTDSAPAKPDQGPKEDSNISLNQNLGTLYNQDFFVADTTGRRLSQILHKSNYPYPLPNGHSALQLRLPDLLIYLKTDTYLMDVHTGEHYAVYSDRIQKMSVTPKLYSAWGYRQL